MFVNKYFTFVDEEDGAENKTLVEPNFFSDIFFDVFTRMGLSVFNTKDDHRDFLSALGVADEGFAKMCRDFIPRWNAMREIVRTAAKLEGGGLLGNLQKTWLQGQKKSMGGDKGANQLGIYVFDKLRPHVTGRRLEKAMRVARGVAKKMAELWKGIVEPAKRIGVFLDPTDSWPPDVGFGQDNVEVFGHDIGGSLSLYSL